MDYLAPPVSLLLCVKREMERGKAVRFGILAYLQCHQDEFSDQVRHWWSLHQQGLAPEAALSQIPSLHRRALLQILGRGLRGESILNQLHQLEIELIEACQEDMQRFLQRLPFKLLLPLLFLQFPAFLMLLFGPLLQNFFHSFGGQ